MDRVMPKSKTVVIGMPYDDLATRIASEWFDEAIPYLESKGFKVVTLRKEENNKQLFDASIKGNDAVGYTGVGHGGGSPQRYTGWHEANLLVEGFQEDAELMKGRVNYFLSCNIGEKLIPWLVSQGMKAGLGYNEPYTFLPGADAEYFNDTSVRVILKTLADGQGIRDAFNTSQGRFDHWIDHFKNDIFKKQLYDLLVYDKRIQCLSVSDDPNPGWYEGEQPPPPPPPPPVSKCPFEDCDFEGIPTDLCIHMREKHCRPAKPPEPTPCVLPGFIRKWLGCSLNGQS